MFSFFIYIKKLSFLCSGYLVFNKTVITVFMYFPTPSFFVFDDNSDVGLYLKSKAEISLSILLHYKYVAGLCLKWPLENNVLICTWLSMIVRCFLYLNTRYMQTHEITPIRPASLVFIFHCKTFAFYTVCKHLNQSFISVLITINIDLFHCLYAFFQWL